MKKYENWQSPYETAKKFFAFPCLLIILFSEKLKKEVENEKATKEKRIVPHIINVR